MRIYFYLQKKRLQQHTYIINGYNTYFPDSIYFSFALIYICLSNLFVQIYSFIAHPKSEL